MRSNGFKFSYNLSTEKIRAFYRRKSKPIVCWLEECFEPTGNDADFVRKEELYPDFKTWCVENSMKTIPSGDKFSKTLKDEGFEAIQLEILNRKRAYVGYKLLTHKVTTETPPSFSEVPKEVKKEGEKRGIKMVVTL